MLFSIIIPIYNVEQYLEDCLNSVVSQTYSDFEVICINDGSTDNSLSILNEFAHKDSRIIVVNQINKGPSEARNAGLKLAKGEYVMFVDSDDWIADNALEILSHHLEGQDFIAFNSSRVLENNKRLVDDGVDETIISGWDYLNKYILCERPVAFVSVFLRLYKRAFLQHYNLFFLKDVYHEDAIFTPLVCYYAEKVTSITDVLYYYRVREGSIMTMKDTEKNIQKRKDMIAIANKLSLFFEDKQIEKYSINRFVAGLYITPFLPSYAMPQYEIEFLKVIDWDKFRQVCTYPRNKRIYRMIKISPKIFRGYLSIAKLMR